MAQAGIDAAAPSARDEIERLLAAGERGAAIAVAQRLWKGSPDASVARFLSSRLAPSSPEAAPHKLAILRSFTLEPVVPLLQAEAALAGIHVACWLGEFNAYGQEILDPGSALYGFQADTVILAVQTRDIAPALWDRFVELTDDQAEAAAQETAETLIGLLTVLRSNSAANIVCHGLERPLTANAGLLDARREGLSQAEAIAAVNCRLRRWCAGQPGVSFLDYDDLQARHGRASWIDEKKWAAVRLPLSVRALAWLAAEWWRRLATLCLPPAKVLVLDLDNTLWGGLAGEEGIHGVKLGDESPGVFYKRFQQAIRDIARRGVILAVASKNNLADAMQIIDEHPDMLIRGDQFAAIRIDWASKVDNLIGMADELNLGLDSFIFVDDNPAECDAVRRALPEVQVIELPADPSTYADLIRQEPRLERLSVSSEDTQRHRYYGEERQRRDLQRGGESLEGFLHSLDIEIEAEPIGPQSLTRAAQLTQKTNQLNMTTRRFTEAQLADQLQTAGWLGYTLRARDRFGDNGIIGVALLSLEGQACEIDTFLMSCRVIGRKIETGFLAILAEVARDRGAETLSGWFRPTPKNAPAAGIYPNASFSLADSDGEASRWSVDLSGEAPTIPPWIRRCDPTSAAA